MAPMLKAEGITLNCFCPGLIDTSLTAPLTALTPEEYITPMTTVLQAYDRFIDGEETGCAAELSKDMIYMREPPEYPDRFQKWQMANLKQLSIKARELAKQK